MQDQEESKNQEIQEKQKQENNGAMTKLQDVFNLAHDQAHPDKIDATIRANTRVTGTNMWVLMFAIAVASIGLNVNSTAVVIGAMLISPLMGPIAVDGADCRYGLRFGGRGYCADPSSRAQYYYIRRHQLDYRYVVFPVNPA